MIITLTVDGDPCCEIDTQLFEVRSAGRLKQVEPQVFAVLSYLVQHRNRVVSRAELLQQLWPDSVVSDAALSHCIMAARQAIGDTGKRQCMVKTYHRRGYRIVANVAVTGPDSKRQRTQPALGSLG